MNTDKHGYEAGTWASARFSAPVRSGVTSALTPALTRGRGGAKRPSLRFECHSPRSLVFGSPRIHQAVANAGARRTISRCVDKDLECGAGSPLLAPGRPAGQAEPRPAARQNSTAQPARRRQVACAKRRELAALQSPVAAAPPRCVHPGSSVFSNSEIQP
jgi:hypothetical protein